MARGCDPGPPNGHYLMYFHGEEIVPNAKELRKQYVGLY